MKAPLPNFLVAVFSILPSYYFLDYLTKPIGPWCMPLRFHFNPGLYLTKWGSLSGILDVNDLTSPGRKIKLLFFKTRKKKNMLQIMFGITKFKKWISKKKKSREQERNFVINKWSFKQMESLMSRMIESNQVC